MKNTLILFILTAFISCTKPSAPLVVSQQVTMTMTLSITEVCDYAYVIVQRTNGTEWRTEISNSIFAEHKEVLIQLQTGETYSIYSTNCLKSELK
jgi:hypothetical protein